MGSKKTDGCWSIQERLPNESLGFCFAEAWDFNVAHDAWISAVQNYPGRWIELRVGARIICDSKNPEDMARVKRSPSTIPCAKLSDVAAKA